MILTIKKADYESKLKTDLVKNNLLEICKWFNFIEDNGLTVFADNHITMYVTLDYHIDSPNRYMNNGVYFSSYGMAVGGLRQSSSVRIPCSIPNVMMYLWMQYDEKYMCLMFHEVGQKEIYVHRYVSRVYGND